MGCQSPVSTVIGIYIYFGYFREFPQMEITSTLRLWHPFGCSSFHSSLSFIPPPSRFHRAFVTLCMPRASSELVISLCKSPTCVPCIELLTACRSSIVCIPASPLKLMSKNTDKSGTECQIYSKRNGRRVALAERNE